MIDFEVTADGEVTKYIGLGGDAKLPENSRTLGNVDVFFSKPHIRSLYLPQSFIGLSEQYSVAMGRVDLPDLERYEVHTDNPAFAEKDGLLYSKDFLMLISCPAQYEGKVVLDDRCKDICDYAFYGCSKVTDIVLSSSMTYFDDTNINIFGEHGPKFVRIFGENVEVIHRWHKSKVLEELTALRKAALIFPNYIFNYEHKVYKLAMAMGFCLSPESFDAKHKTSLRKVISNFRFELLALAKNLKAKEVVDFIENNGRSDKGSSKKTTRISKPDLHKEQPGRQAVELLEDRICYGTVEEVKTVIDVNRYFLLTSRALGLACRYGSLEKVKLLSKIASFAKVFLTKSDLSSLGCFVPGSNQKLVANYWFLPVIDYFRPEFLGESRCLARDDNGEVTGANLLSESDRAVIIKFLADKEVLSKDDVDAMCVWALVFGNCMLAKKLKALGASLSIFKNVLNGKSNSTLYYRFASILFKDHPQAAIVLSELAQDEGFDLKVRTGVDLSSYYNDHELLAELLDKLKFEKEAIKELSKAVIQNNMIDALKVIMESKQAKPALVKELIELSTDLGSNEITSTLLDYSNKRSKTKSKTTKRKTALSL